MLLLVSFLDNFPEDKDIECSDSDADSAGEFIQDDGAKSITSLQNIESLPDDAEKGLTESSKKEDIISSNPNSQAGPSIFTHHVIQKTKNPQETDPQIDSPVKQTLIDTASVSAARSEPAFLIAQSQNLLKRDKGKEKTPFRAPSTKEFVADMRITTAYVKLRDQLA